MIGVALLGGVSLFTMHIMTEQKMNEVYTASKAEVQKTKSIIQQSLVKSDNCRSTFENHLLPIDTTGVDIDEIRTAPTIAGIQKILLQSKTAYPGFKVGKISLVRDDLGPILTSGPSDNPFPVNSHLRIEFLIKKRNSSSWNTSGSTYFGIGHQLIIEKIPMIVITASETDHRIVGCKLSTDTAIQSAKEKFCKSLGALVFWDTSTNVCKFLNNTCPYGEVVVKLDNSGQIICDKIEKAMNLNDLFSSNSCMITNGIRIINVGGKLQISCPP